MILKSDIDKTILDAARIVVSYVLQVRSGERILIITNPDIEVAIPSQALYYATLEVQAAPTLVYQEVKSQLCFAEPQVYGAMRADPEVVISITKNKVGKDREAMSNPFEVDGKKVYSYLHYLLLTKRSRSFWSPSITREMFATMIPVDYERMRREAAWIKRIFDGAVSLKVTSPGGTNIQFGLKGRLGMVDDGDFSKPGAGGNLPAGETFISPENETANGRIVFDGSLDTHSGTIMLDEPVSVEFQQGYIVDISGGQGSELLKESIRLGEENAISFEKEGKLSSGQGKIYARNARALGEIGIGLNPLATIQGNMLGDEKAYKTCHFAIGSNYDDDAEALIHLDALVRSPDITATMEDGKEVKVCDEGNLLATKGR